MTDKNLETRYNMDDLRTANYSYMQASFRLRDVTNRYIQKYIDGCADIKALDELEESVTYHCGLRLQEPLYKQFEAKREQLHGQPDNTTDS